MRLQRAHLGLKVFFSRFQDPQNLRRALESISPIDAPLPGRGLRQLLVDISVLACEDAGTGIQRATKSLLAELVAAPPDGYVVRIVEASRWRGYRYAEELTARSKIVEVRAGDVFLGLDFASRVFPRHQLQLLAWRAAGAKICVVMYDMLPLLRPDWFTARNCRAYKAWIRAVGIHADSVVCISQLVATQFNVWLSAHSLTSHSPKVGWFHLGTQAAPSKLPTIVDPLIQRIMRFPFVLMVGTIEPRKGYAQALDAFETLWRTGHVVRLVIAGRAGWKVGRLLKRLRTHPEAGSRLHWLDNADDGTLSLLYGRAIGVLLASEAEGFGLPILEAASYNKSLLLRDTPVFREVAGPAASYFDANAADRLAAHLSHWVSQLASGTAISSATLPRQTWADSAQQLLANLPLIPSPQVPRFEPIPAALEQCRPRG
jgi:glycosyltransferase involved in cell wall biosynthesis